jgi:23S rRNA (cytosine1962-C5)-methyltransferase
MTCLARALDARAGLFDSRHEAAFRLFNGFIEGTLDLAADLYGRTLVLHNHADPAESIRSDLAAIQDFYLRRLPWLQTVIVKTRGSADPLERRGVITLGETPERKVRENSTWYAVDLQMNSDASLYLDTRNLRGWALQNLKARTVLNAFAYTGSLGVAAQAGGAARVVQLDKNSRFLDFAKSSCTLNGFPVSEQDFIAGDFWPQIAALKRSGERFDCVIIDPPFFSATQKGVVDLARNSARLINKVRPLINDGGTLVAINNALFVSGRAYLETLQSLCADGYLKIEALIPVPADFSGYPATRRGEPVTDPAPFNHATKIAILKVRRKAG